MHDWRGLEFLKRYIKKLATVNSGKNCKVEIENEWET